MQWHWPSYEHGTWGIILGVAAIVLAIPLSVVGNLITPKIRNAWTERSTKAARKRLERLKADLMKSEHVPEISEVDDFTLRGVQVILLLFGQLLAIIVALQIPESARWYELGLSGKRLIVGVAALLTAFLAYFIARRYGSFSGNPLAKIAPKETKRNSAA